MTLMQLNHQIHCKKMKLNVTVQPQSEWTSIFYFCIGKNRSTVEGEEEALSSGLCVLAALTLGSSLNVAQRHFSKGQSSHRHRLFIREAPNVTLVLLIPQYANLTEREWKKKLLITFFSPKNHIFIFSLL